MVNENTRVAFAAWPVAPLAGQTKILFCNKPKAPGGVGAVQQPTELVPGPVSRQVDPSDLQAITVTFLANNAASAANGVRVWAWNSFDQTWREVDCKDQNDLPTIGAAAPVQVPVIAAGQEYKVRVEVASYEGVAIEYTAVDAPTDWAGSIALHLNSASIVL